MGKNMAYAGLGAAVVGTAYAVYDAAFNGGCWALAGLGGNATGLASIWALVEYACADQGDSPCAGCEDMGGYCRGCTRR